MAESVDALVSNTSGAIRAGSTPAQGTKEGCQLIELQPFFCLLGRKEPCKHRNIGKSCETTYGISRNAPL